MRKFYIWYLANGGAIILISDTLENAIALATTKLGVYAYKIKDIVPATYPVDHIFMITEF